MEKEQKIEPGQSVNENPEISSFIVNRNIESCDVVLINKLANFPKDLVIKDLHNLFNTDQDRSGEYLSRQIETTEDEMQKDLLVTVNEFYSKYGWQATYHLVRVLERL